MIQVKTSVLCRRDICSLIRSNFFLKQIERKEDRKKFKTVVEIWESREYFMYPFRVGDAYLIVGRIIIKKSSQ